MAMALSAGRVGEGTGAGAAVGVIRQQASMQGSGPHTAATPARSVVEVSPAEVRRWLAEGQAVLVDVREADEHTRERISGTRLVPLSVFDPGRVAAGVNPGQRIVLHCKGGKRSADACRHAAVLAGAGYSVFSLAGGIDAWKAAGLPVEIGARACRVSVMRQVQIVVGLSVFTGSLLASWIHPAFVTIPAFFGAGLTFAGVTGTCALAGVLGVMPWNRLR